MREEHRPGRRRSRYTYELLTETGFVHGDPRLHNFLRLDTGNGAIDFESVSGPPPRPI